MIITGLLLPEVTYLLEELPSNTIMFYQNVERDRFNNGNPATKLSMYHKVVPMVLSSYFRTVGANDMHTSTPSYGRTYDLKQLVKGNIKKYVIVRYLPKNNTYSINYVETNKLVFSIHKLISKGKSWRS